MTPALDPNQAPIPPPSYHRRMVRALHLDALTLVSQLRLLALCRVAVRLAHQRCPPALPAGPGGAPRVYSEEALLLLALLRTLWRLSYQELHDWLSAWPALALAVRAAGTAASPLSLLRPPYLVIALSWAVIDEDRKPADFLIEVQAVFHRELHALCTCWRIDPAVHLEHGLKCVV